MSRQLLQLGNSISRKMHPHVQIMEKKKKVNEMSDLCKYWSGSHNETKCRQTVLLDDNIAHGTVAFTVQVPLSNPCIDFSRINEGNQQMLLDCVIKTAVNVCNKYRMVLVGL